ncbi:UDP-N-acetylglucosamine 4,6-dehydratase (inverting) [Desulfofundulus thermocisternus]|uniref:UDP-N-acetylglucosamine 4,6-dehydratase (inverting) n=1 Tax=Desulfofundulus thermocisternus TaxID=42471 RepID=UPI00217EC7C6|nr:UDP-N-acetylglucosamine 4,6-dehydratase (inverting) [Desulfofundulus thermocisternus]MCS5696641.1 UDP-N-acetylglucosamine 4,6-dehydratase (inverting) [Desulfofundulus thermocisternus]
MLEGKSILITGGTGSFGKKFVETVLSRFTPKRLIILSRDELKQFEMQQTFSPQKYPCLRYFIGDVRDKERLYRAFYGVDYVIHAAALKQVPAAEYNPFEAVQTNIIGTQNVIDAAIDCGVQRVIALSTDKAVSPVNLYGATKLCLEKLVVAGNSYAGGRTRFSVVRYGNVVGSRGSVIPLFLKQKETGVLTVTDERMTRFWITLEQGVSFVLHCLKIMHGGEVFVPKIPSMRIIDLARAICPECEIKYIGIRPGEKIHEVLISRDEARNALDLGRFYVIKPAFSYWTSGNWVTGQPVPEEWEYASNNNEQWLGVEDLRRLLQNKESSEFHFETTINWNK